MLSSFLLQLLAAASPLLVAAVNYDASVFTNESAAAYDHAKFGRFPTVHFRSSKLVSPRVLKRKWDPICDDDEYFYFLSTYGAANEHPGPIIFDHNGQMVWHDEGYPRSYGVMVQDYQGEPHMTWWTGDDSIRGHGIGNYYILDSTYRMKRQLGALDNFPADLHEFKITGNTVIVTSFATTPMDLTKYGMPQDGHLWDGVFQEYNLDTNELIFEWRASDHMQLDDCLDIRSTLKPAAGSREHEWDFFHINSVEKDPKGNYLISARYCALTYVSGVTGEVIWRLGGKKSSFTQKSGVGLGFRFQHHARWSDNYKTITMFDNRATDKFGHDKPSRGLKLIVDQNEMTVDIDLELMHPEGWVGESQGSMQSLDNGNYLLGFGHAAAFTEFYPNGEVACDIQFAALRWTDDPNRIYGGSGQSYRAFKQKWVGKPHYNPKVFFGEFGMFVSWNGATEVRTWRLEGSVDRKTWTNLGDVPKTGFETHVAIEQGSKAFVIYRLTAFCKKNTQLGQWTAFRSGAVQTTDKPQATLLAEARRMQPRGIFAVVASFTTGVATTFFLLFFCRRHRRGSSFLLREKGRSDSWNGHTDSKLQRLALLHSSDESDDL